MFSPDKMKTSTRTPKIVATIRTPEPSLGMIEFGICVSSTSRAPSGST